MGKWMGNWGYSRCKWSYNPVTCLYAHFVELEDWELAEISSEVDLHSRFQVCEGADMSWFDSRKSRCSYVFHFRFLRSCFKFRTIDNHKMGMYTNENQHDNEKATSWLFEDVSPINNYDFSASHHNLLECSLRCFFRCCSVCIFQTPENYWRLELELVYFLSCQGVQWKTAPCFSFSVSVLPVWFDGSSRIWHVFEVDWSRILSGILGRWKPNFRRSKLEEHVWDLYGIYDQQFDVFRSFCLLLVGGSVSFNSTWSKNHLHRCAETLFGAPRASPLECCSYCMAWSEHQKGWVWLTLHLEVVAKTCSQVVLWEKFMTWWGKFSQTWVSTSLPWFSLVSSPTRPAIFILFKTLCRWWS